MHSMRGARFKMHARGRSAVSISDATHDVRDYMRYAYAATHVNARSAPSDVVEEHGSPKSAHIDR